MHWLHSKAPLGNKLLLLSDSGPPETGAFPRAPTQALGFAVVGWALAHAHL